MSCPSIASIDEVARSGNPPAEAARESLAQFAHFRRLVQDAIHMCRYIALGNESPAPTRQQKDDWFPSQSPAGGSLGRRDDLPLTRRCAPRDQAVKH
jgi:hypothetical protein